MLHDVASSESPRDDVVDDVAKDATNRSHAVQQIRSRQMGENPSPNLHGESRYIDSLRICQVLNKVGYPILNTFLKHVSSIFIECTYSNHSSL